HRSQVEVLLLVGLREPRPDGAEDAKRENDDPSGKGQAVLAKPMPGVEPGGMAMFGRLDPDGGDSPGGKGDSHSKRSFGLSQTCATSTTRFITMIRPAYRITVPRI